MTITVYILKRKEDGNFEISYEGGGIHYLIIHHLYRFPQEFYFQVI